MCYHERKIFYFYVHGVIKSIILSSNHIQWTLDITNTEGTQKKVHYIESSLYLGYIENFQKKIQWEKPPIIIPGKRRQDRNANNSSFLSRTLKLHKVTLNFFLKIKKKLKTVKFFKNVYVFTHFLPNVMVEKCVKNFWIWRWCHHNINFVDVLKDELSKLW